MDLILHSDLLKALGWSLINSIWQMAVCWLVYMMALPVIRSLPKVKHTVALLLVMAGSGWFVVSFIRTIFYGTDLSFFSATANKWMQLIYDGRQFISGFIPLLSFLYMAMLLILSARYIKYYRLSKELKFTGIQKIQPELRLFTASIANRMGITKKVSVWLSSVVVSPMTVGFLKPVILIPIATINHLTIKQVEAILLHELAHIKRNDYLLNLFITVSELVFFFNPFSRLLIHTIKKEREYCCDDMVMQFQYDPYTYSSALLSLEKNRHRHQQLAMAAIGKSHQLLLERVRRVTGHSGTKKYFSSRIVVLLFFAFLTACVTLLQPVKNISRVIAVFKPGNAMVTENLQIAYSNPSSVYKVSNKKSTSIKTSTAHNSERMNTVHLDNVSLINKEEDADAIDNDETPGISTATLQAPEREFSITPSAAAIPPVESTDNLPYVPTSSFSFQETEDSSPVVTMSFNQQQAKETMDKALSALDAINWEKIKKEITASGKKIDVKKLQEQIRISLKELNWEKLDQNATTALTAAEERKLNENMRLEIHALQNASRNSQLDNNRLQKKVLEEKLRLQQEYQRKQKEILKQVEDVLKKSKIVYI